jgi:hypothetical protein
MATSSRRPHYDRHNGVPKMGRKWMTCLLAIWVTDFLGYDNESVVGNLTKRTFYGTLYLAWFRHVG